MKCQILDLQDSSEKAFDNFQRKAKPLPKRENRTNREGVECPHSTDRNTRRPWAVTLTRIWDKIIVRFDSNFINHMVFKNGIIFGIANMFTQSIYCVAIMVDRIHKAKFPVSNKQLLPVIMHLQKPNTIVIYSLVLQKFK